MAVLWRLLGYLKPYPGRTALAILSMIGATIFSLIVPRLTGLAIDQGLGSRQMSVLWLFVGLIIGATVLRGVCAYGQAYLGEYLGQRVAYDLRNRIYDHVQRMSFAFHDRNQTGQLMSRATQDVEASRIFFSFALQNLLQTLLLLVGTLVLLAGVDIRLSAIAIVTLPITSAVAAFVSSRLRPMWTQVQQQTAILTTFLQESLAGIRVIRSFAREDQRIIDFHGVNNPLRELNIRTARLQAFNGPLMGMILGVATAFSLWVGGSSVIGGSLTVGDLVAFIGYLALLTRPVRFLGFMVNVISRTSASAERIFDLLDTKSDVQEKDGAVELKHVKGLVRFEDVSFHYRKQASVLDSISIEARPGEVVALLGATGSGKSTITMLLPRFYDVTGGRITIDGRDIRDVTLESLRQHIGLVLQDTFLFSATIRDNIAYGRDDIDFEKVVEAAKAASAHDFITSFPNGYDTWVGERGVTLSGGQKQRIAIARTLLLDPQILILDDSTSSVDTETELHIQQALQHLMQGRTTFVIAQRLRTVRNADQILVLENGHIVERGRHEDLVEGTGPYRKIYDLQLRDQEELAATLAGQAVSR